MLMQQYHRLSITLIPETQTPANRKVVIPPSTHTGMEVKNAPTYAYAQRLITQLGSRAGLREVNDSNYATSAACCH